MKQLFLLLMSFMLLTSTNLMYAQNEQPIETEKVQEKVLSKAEKDSILFEKLNADQLLDLKKSELEMELEKIKAINHGDMPLNNFSIVLICLFPFAFIVTLVFLNVRRKNMESKRKYDLYMKSLEMGQTIPEHFFDEPKENGKASNLKRGIILLMVGISFGIFVIIQKNTSMPFLLAAIIPTFVGIGYLLVHKLEKPKESTSANRDEQIG